MLYLFCLLTLGLVLLLKLLLILLEKKIILSQEMSDVFECGASSIKFFMIPFSLRFFFLSILFLIFDVELIMMFPYLMKLFSGSNMFYMVSFFLFLLLVTWGLFLEWEKLLLDWSN